VTRVVPESPEAERIDAALAEWRQGDLALGEQWFTHIAEPAFALTPESARADDGWCRYWRRWRRGRMPAITSEVGGLVLVTQTCDVVRSCVERPFVEAAPLVEVSEDVLREIERGRRPAYAAIPVVSDQRLVADIDRVMTVEKSVVAIWERTPGYTTDEEVRTFARALARKRARFAFPDDFTRLARKLQDRLHRKHDKDSEEGRALRALREIRVRAAPSWDADQVKIIFWFIRTENAGARRSGGIQPKNLSSVALSRP
jgi:hypothetical protein